MKHPAQETGSAYPGAYASRQISLMLQIGDSVVPLHVTLACQKRKGPVSKSVKTSPPCQTKKSPVAAPPVEATPGPEHIATRLSVQSAVSEQGETPASGHLQMYVSEHEETLGQGQEWG